MPVDKAWVDNPRVAPYVWEALRDYGTAGMLVIAAQYPPLVNYETPFSAIGFDLVPRTVARPDDVHTFVNTRVDTIRMRAKPLRDASVWPTIEHDIAPGDRLVWCRRVIMPFHTMEQEVATVDQFETFLFGRETPAGEVVLMQIWPNAEFKHFTSYKDAFGII